MIIKKLEVFFEKPVYAANYVKIKSIVTDNMGMEHGIVGMYHEDDLRTHFDVLWQAAGERLEQYLKSKDWKNEVILDTGKTV